jgi:hypothetical protein
MAQELTATGSVFFSKGSVASNGLVISGKKFDVAGKDYIRKSQNIGTSAEALDLGDVSTAGWFFIQNNDITNFVELLDAVAGNVFMKLKPGEFACGRFGCAAPAAKANTAACDVEYIIVAN